MTLLGSFETDSQSGYYVHQPFESVAVFPCILRAQERRACRIPMLAEPEGSALKLVLQLVVEERDDMLPLGISLNGAWQRFDGKPDKRLLFAVANMTHHDPGHIGWNFTFPIDVIREGWNYIVVMNGAPPTEINPKAKNSIMIFSIELAVCSNQKP